jgi:hypothetical protein
LPDISSLFGIMTVKAKAFPWHKAADATIPEAGPEE